MPGEQDFTQPFQPNHVLNLVFGRFNLDGVSGPYIEVWVKDPISGTVTTKHWHENEVSEMFAFLFTTLRIMNLRNRVLHEEQRSAISNAQQPRSAVKKKKSPSLSLNLEDLI